MINLTRRPTLASGPAFSSCCCCLACCSCAESGKRARYRKRWRKVKRTMPFQSFTIVFVPTLAELHAKSLPAPLSELPADPPTGLDATSNQQEIQNGHAIVVAEATTLRSKQTPSQRKQSTPRPHPDNSPMFPSPMFLWRPQSPAYRTTQRRRHPGLIP
jgi:hypothetical protein